MVSANGASWSGVAGVIPFGKRTALEESVTLTNLIFDHHEESPIGESEYFLTYFYLEILIAFLPCILKKEIGRSST